MTLYSRRETKWKSFLAKLVYVFAGSSLKCHLIEGGANLLGYNLGPLPAPPSRQHLSAPSIVPLTSLPTLLSVHSINRTISKCEGSSMWGWGWCRNFAASWEVLRVDEKISGTVVCMYVSVFVRERERVVLCGRRGQGGWGGPKDVVYRPTSWGKIYRLRA